MALIRKITKMKKNIVTLIVTLALVMWSCEKDIVVHTGFCSPIQKNSEGITILEVKSNIKYLNLTGKITLAEGEVEIKLLNPDNVAVYTLRLHSNENVSVYETFFTEPGFWKLKYKSIQGVGSIDLHLNFVD